MAARRKTIKKLYKRLKEYQTHDVCMTAPGLVEIKFYLRHHNRCGQVLLQDDIKSALISTPPELPLFLQSQLEAQRIVANDYRQSLQVSAILHFALDHFARQPSKDKSFPALFLWHSPDKRRNYCLFAYLTCPMASHVYSAPELLGLRDSQSSQALLNKVKLNPDLADVIKGGGFSNHSRRLKKSKEDPLSSTDSEDHIVFQGKRQSRPPISASNGEAEWKPRGRTESEYALLEPRPAPIGLAAQQSEGFQRFFKAVVSPTHVRVTAGGRIVPNTRASTSPTAKWDRDRSGADSDAGDIGKQRTQENGAPLSGPMQPPMPPAMMPPMASPMYPGFPHMFPQVGAPMPFFPMPNGMPLMYGGPQMQSPMGPVPPSETAQGQKQEGDKSTATGVTNGQDDGKPRPAPVKISPPEQFDHSKPYFYNGHLVYPPLASAQLHASMTPLPPSPYFPSGVAGHPGFAPARAASYAHPSPVPPMISPNGVPPPHQFGPHVSAVPQNTQPQPGQKSAAPTTTPSVQPPPPITSIKPSEITKRQLNSLRSSLKYYEDQLQYNKHQIDEKWTQEQTSGIRKLIEQFEHNYKMQLNFETTYYPNGEKRSAFAETTNGSNKAPCQTPSRASSMKDEAKETVSKPGSVRSVNQTVQSLSHAQSMDQIHTRSVKDRRQKAGINSSKGNDTSSVLNALEAHLKSPQSSDPIKKSSLPTAAALAPPFEPRGTPSLPVADGPTSTDFQMDSSRLLPLSQPGLWSHANGHASEGQVSPTPYLVGKLPPGVNPYNARTADYTYSRELTEEEKRARHIYWGQVEVKGLGLPKFDGKDFYPPSPVKSVEKTEGPPKLKLRQIPTGRPDVDYNFEFSKTDNDPFRASRDAESIRSDKSGAKFSRAVPIVNPESLNRENGKMSKVSNSFASHASTNSEDNRKVHGDNFQVVSPTKSSAGSASEKKSTSLSRRALERSSTKSANELWQSMLKKGSTSGAALPSAVSSTTATGYLPQYTGHAAAMLSPAIANANGSPTRVSTVLPRKSSEHGVIISQLSTEKLGENCPPHEASKEAEIIADLHQRMLRDAELRGVIGPGWRQ